MLHCYCTIKYKIKNAEILYIRKYPNFLCIVFIPGLS